MDRVKTYQGLTQAILEPKVIAYRPHRMHDLQVVLNGTVSADLEHWPWSLSCVVGTSYNLKDSEMRKVWGLT